MIRLLRILFFLVCLFAPLLVHAQALPIDKLTPPLESQQGQSFMRGMSWGTLGAVVALKTWETAHAPDKKKALVFEAAGLTATGLTSLAVKMLVGRDRPCAPADCGAEDPHKAFWSGHVANACFSIPMASGRGAAIAGSLLALGTAIGRILGNRHFLTDTLAGCASGLTFGWLTKRLTY